MGAAEAPARPQGNAKARQSMAAAIGKGKR